MADWLTEWPNGLLSQSVTNMVMFFHRYFRHMTSSIVLWQFQCYRSPLVRVSLCVAVSLWCLMVDWRTRWLTESIKDINMIIFLHRHLDMTCSIVLWQCQCYTYTWSLLFEWVCVVDVSLPSLWCVHIWLVLLTGWYITCDSHITYGSPHPSLDRASPAS